MKTMKKYIFALIATMFLPLSMMAQDPVAKIGDTPYATLAEAVNAANALGNCTITLLQDIDFSQSPYDVYKWAGSTYNPLEITANDVTIDLNQHTISNMGMLPLCLVTYWLRMVGLAMLQLRMVR